MVGKFLITTSLEDTWPEEDLPVIFLGEWCKPYVRKGDKSFTSSDTVPYHWDDREKLYADYIYLQKLNDKVLFDLSKKLNEIHKVNYSVRYWRILIGPWLGMFIQVLFDRWCSVKEVIDKYEINGTIVYVGREELLLPNDMNDFFIFLKTGTEWNHYLYSEILLNYSTVPCIKKERPDLRKTGYLLPVTNWKNRIKKKVNSILSNVFISLFQSEDDIFFYNTYLPFSKELQLLLKFRQAPHLLTFPAPNKFQALINFRNWNLEGKDLSDFESFLYSIIPNQLPKVYLEGYKVTISQMGDLRLPKYPKLIWTSNSHYIDDVFKIWTASKVENGTCLVIGQHGGNYGIGKWLFGEDHEIAICDAFLSWGWTDYHKSKIKPIGQLKHKKPFNVDHFKQDGILLVTTMVPQQSYQLFSCTIAGQWLYYLNDQFRFIEGLPELLKNKLTVRLMPYDWGWDQFDRWNDKYPHIKIDNGISNIDEQIKKCRIYVASYNATAYLESFTMNVPTVIFWDPNFWEIRDSAIPFFNELKRVKIFHETPEAAALHISQVWNNLEAWWNSKEVVEVVNLFKKEYCDSSNKLVDKLESTLQQVMSDNVENEQAQCR